MSLANLEVHAGRLAKKVARLKQQRDHWQEQYQALRKVLDAFPFIESQHDRYMLRREEAVRVRGLEARVKEQAALIELLQRQESRS